MFTSLTRADTQYVAVAVNDDDADGEPTPFVQPPLISTTRYYAFSVLLAIASVRTPSFHGMGIDNFIFTRTFCVVMGTYF
jgi:hypothetical protein